MGRCLAKLLHKENADFRTDLQLEATVDVYSGRDLVYVAATGSGKTVVYRIPNSMHHGVTVVICPFVALQNELQGDDVCTRFVINMSIHTIKKVLLVSIEQVQYCLTIVNQLALESRLIGIVFDEIHVMLHDTFRAIIFERINWRSMLPAVPFLFLSATLPPGYKTMIDDAFACPSRPINIIRETADRPEIFFRFIERSDVFQRDELIRNIVSEWISREISRGIYSRCIIFVRDVASVEYISKVVSDFQKPMFQFHSKMSDREKISSFDSFNVSTLGMMVATSAFSTGINCDGVCLILHVGMPYDILSHYQGIGRGGRKRLDAVPAFCSAFTVVTSQEFATASSQIQDFVCKCLSTSCIRQQFLLYLDGSTASTCHAKSSRVRCQNCEGRKCSDTPIMLNAPVPEAPVIERKVHQDSLAEARSRLTVAFQTSVSCVNDFNKKNCFMCFLMHQEKGIVHSGQCPVYSQKCLRCLSGSHQATKCDKKVLNLQNTCGYCYCQLRANGLGLHGSIVDCQNKAKNLMGPAVWLVFRIMNALVDCEEAPKRAIVRSLLAFEPNIRMDENSFFTWLLETDHQTGLLHICAMFAMLAKIIN